MKVALPSATFSTTLKSSMLTVAVTTGVSSLSVMVAAELLPAPMVTPVGSGLPPQVSSASVVD